MLTHTQALDAIAAKHGYASWSMLMREQNRFERDDKKDTRCKDIQPGENAYLSAYDQPTYLKTIFRG